LEKLRGIVGEMLALSLGCDFQFSYENLQDALAHPDRYVIGESRYLLVELSGFLMPHYVGEHLARLRDAGMNPIITHPERNLVLQRNPQALLRWVHAGCAVQVTASSLTGHWGKRSGQVARWLLEHEAVHVLASDAHNADERPPVLSAARDIVTKRYGADVAQALVEQNPQAIVTGQPLPYYPQAQK
jgi:protein-tyrosine phosphatase